MSKKQPVFKAHQIPPFVLQIKTGQGFLYRLWFLISSPIIRLFKGEVKIK